MKNYVLLLLTLVVMVSYAMGLRSIKILYFPNDNADLHIKRLKNEDEKNDRIKPLNNHSEEECLADPLTKNISKNKAADYSRSDTLNAPDSSRYTRIVLAQGFDEPLG
ncbi:MAG: hypothetical protein WC220_07790, partial [Pedobacter sp.]